MMGAVRPRHGRLVTQQRGIQAVTVDSFAEDLPASKLRTGFDGSLPPTLAARAFGPAWVVAVLAHFLLVGVALLPPATQPPEEPLVRLVFVEPPPPPPTLLGAPTGVGTVPAMPEPVLEPKAPEQPKEPVQPEVKEPERLKRADAKAKPKPKLQAKAAEEPRREPAPAEIAPGIATGSVGGEAGGVAGGIVGGVVGGSGTVPVPAGQVAHPPTLVHRVAPTYPDDARRREIEGLVVLEAVLDRDGRIEPGVKVVRSIPAFDDEALRAVQQWRFRPARDASGRTLRVILEVPIRFVLR